MTDLQERRKKSGMSQFLLAKESGISRMRLSLAETGQVPLSGDEETAIWRVLNAHIARKAREIALLSDEIETRVLFADMSPDRSHRDDG